MTRTAMDYADYQHLLFDRKENGVLLVTLNRPDVYNATDARLHWELTQIWRTVDADPKTKVVLVTGAGKAFSAGGDITMLDQIVDKPEGVLRAMREAADIVYEMTNLDKPIITAINGVAVGAGLAVALCADISIMSETAKITDGHVRLGVGAGDHAAILWPILCGMAKAKYYLMTADFIDGKEAERIGLVSLCAPPDQLMDKAWEVANKLAAGSQMAIRVTKRSLNNWIRMAGPIFDNSLALEMLCFLNPDAKEGLAALKERRAPKFPSAE
jgi:enoyl-CoA hydratase